MLFPGGRLPLRIFEQRYLEMAKACLRDNSPFGVCLIREGAEVGAAATPAQVGTLARISAWDMPQLGLLQVTALGERRFRILERRVLPDGLARASVELLPEEADSPIPANCAICVRLLERRPGMGLWGGLWTFPETRLYRSTRSRALPPMEHGFTHFRLHIQPVLCEVGKTDSRAEAPGRLWLDVAEAASAAVPAPVRTLLARLPAAR